MVVLLAMARVIPVGTAIPPVPFRPLAIVTVALPAFGDAKTGSLYSIP